MTTEEQRRHDFIEGLRDLTEFLVSRPELQVPHDLYCTVVCSGDEFRAACRLMQSYAKAPLGNIYGAEKTFSGGITYRAITARENVCERKVVGTRTIPAHTEDVVEWDCSDSILEPKETA